VNTTRFRSGLGGEAAGGHSSFGASAAFLLRGRQCLFTTLRDELERAHLFAARILTGLVGGDLCVF
jgi:hypothetical protein